MNENKETIMVVGKNLFPQRMHLEKEFGELLYDQLIFVLENICIENSKSKYSHLGIRLGVYLDSQNEGTRVFEIEKEKSEKFWNFFGHGFYKELKKYSLRQQKLGTDILFQLNEGSLSVKDFEKRI